MKKRWLVLVLAGVLLAFFGGLVKFYWTLSSYTRKPFLKQKLEENYGWKFRFKTVDYQLPRQLKLERVTITGPGEAGNRVKIEARSLVLQTSYRNLLLGRLDPELMVFRRPRLAPGHGLVGGWRRWIKQQTEPKMLPEIRLKRGRLVVPGNSSERASQLSFQKLHFTVLPEINSYKLTLGNLRFGDGNASGKIFLSPKTGGLQLRDFHANFIDLSYIRELFPPGKAPPLLPRGGVVTTHLKKLEYAGGQAEARGDLEFKAGELPPRKLYPWLDSINSRFQARLLVPQGELKARLFSPVVNSINIPGWLVVEKPVTGSGISGEVQLKTGPVSEWGFLFDQLVGVNFTEFLTVNGNVVPGKVNFSHDTAGLRLNGDLQLEDVSVSADDFKENFRGDTAGVRFADGTARLFPAELRSNRSQLRLKGQLKGIFESARQRFDLTVGGETFPLRRLPLFFPGNFFWPRNWQLAGTGSFRNNYRGQVDTPVVQGNLAASKLKFDSVPLRAVEADYSFESDQFVVEPLTGKLHGGQFRSSVVLKRSPSNHFDFWFRVNQADFARLEKLPGFEQLTAGRGNLKAVLSGPPAAPRQWTGRVEIWGRDLRVNEAPTGRLLGLVVESLKRVIRRSLPEYYRDLDLALIGDELGAGNSETEAKSALERLNGQLKFREEKLWVNLRLSSSNFRYRLRGTAAVPEGELNLNLRPRLKEAIVDRIKPGLLKRLFRAELPALKIDGSLSRPRYDSERYLKKLLKAVESRRREAVEQTPGELYREFFSE